MEIRKCNRCKEIFDETMIHHDKLEELWNETTEFDLCDCCRGDLDAWLQGDDLKKKKK